MALAEARDGEQGADGVAGHVLVCPNVRFCRLARGSAVLPPA
jgi:hypothetical protein